MNFVTPFCLAVLSSFLFYFSTSTTVAAVEATKVSEIATSVGRISAYRMAQFRQGAPTRPLKTGVSPSSTKVSYSQSATAANMVTPAILLGMPTIVIICLIIKAFKGD